MTPPTLLLATTSLGKLREMTAALEGLAVQWKTLRDFPDLAPVDETGVTFAENAMLKATTYSRWTSRWALADDSGLEVDALGGAPGVASAHYAGEQRDDAANNAKLLENLRGVPRSRRTARFRCVLALADGDRVLVVTEGALEGVIVDEPKGEHGFGYDPHFWIPSLKRTTAELPPDEKNRLSHRGQALAALRVRLEELVRGVETVGGRANPFGSSPTPHRREA